MLLTDPDEIDKAVVKMLSSFPDETIEKYARDFNVPIQSNKPFGFQHPNLQESIYDKQAREFNESITSSAKYRCLAGLDQKLSKHALSIVSAMANGHLTKWYDLALSGIGHLDLYRAILSYDSQYGGEAASVTASALLDLAKKSKQPVKSTNLSDYYLKSVTDSFIKTPTSEFLSNWYRSLSEPPSDPPYGFKWHPEAVECCEFNLIVDSNGTIYYLDDGHPRATGRWYAIPKDKEEEFFKSLEPKDYTVTFDPRGQHNK